jgi:hypothetical protein
MTDDNKATKDDKTATVTPVEVERLVMPSDAEWKAYCDTVYDQWKEKNPIPKKLPWSVAQEFRNYKDWGERWHRFVEPIAVKWWADRGYKFIFPESKYGDCSVEPI